MAKVVNSSPAASKKPAKNSQTNVDNNIEPRILDILNYISDPKGHPFDSILTVDIIKKIENFQSSFDDFIKGKDMIFQSLVNLASNDEVPNTQFIFMLEKIYELLGLFEDAKKTVSLEGSEPIQVKRERDVQ